VHLSGPIVDTIADYLTIVILFVVPALLIYVFWIIHIMPEKIAERRGHPQTDAIKTLCLLSLVFGGLLWPIAWIWAYSRPVLHKLAYGTDRIEHEAAPADPGSTGAQPATPETPLVKRPAAERRD
jgi:CBS domain containing-hemolysin-like protein